ncbi:helix-turn-helix domain-containing protein [Enterobacter asburiae]|nr:helix-turn-helix domain-containing protein [Enterobacter asburiae]
MNIYLMDLKEVCRTVGFKKTAIYKWMNAGELTPFLVGRENVFFFASKW